MNGLAARPFSILKKHAKSTNIGATPRAQVEFSATTTECYWSPRKKK